MKSPYVFSYEFNGEIYESDLTGDYQIHNRRTALIALRTLQSKSTFTIPEENIKVGFKNVQKNTGLMGRWQQIQSKPKIICDTAHNPHGLIYVTNRLEREEYKTLHVVLGVLNDKKLDEILPLFPKNAKYYFSKPTVPRGLESTILQTKAFEYGLIGNTYNSISEAYHFAVNSALPEDFIFVGGSTFTVAEIL
jgi:dihydrofolate synthase/folylpolyglutamate synthase